MSQFLDISLHLCFEYNIRVSEMIQILEYQNIFYSDFQVLNVIGIEMKNSF